MLHRTGTDDDLFNVIQTLDSDGFVFAIASVFSLTHSNGIIIITNNNKKISAALQLFCFTFWFLWPSSFILV